MIFTNFCFWATPKIVFFFCLAFTIWVDEFKPGLDIGLGLRWVSTQCWPVI
jgi:hypothetical protein